MEYMMADENVLRLLTGWRKRNVEARKKILELERELHERRKLEMELVQLKVKLEALEKSLRNLEMEMEDLKVKLEAKKKMEVMNKELEGKQHDLQDSESTNEFLITKKRPSIDELQEARNVPIQTTTSLRKLLEDRDREHLALLEARDNAARMFEEQEKLNVEMERIKEILKCKLKNNEPLGKHDAA